MTFAYRLLFILGLSIWFLQPAAAAGSAGLPLTFQLDWHPNAQFAGLLLAKERGWYEAAGLDVTILPVDPKMEVVERVVTGPNWLGCSEVGVILAARAKGAPVRAIGTMFQASPMALLSLQTNGYTNMASLIGKTLGVLPDGQRALEVVLAHEGLRRSQFKIIEKEHNTSGLLKGTCAAIQGYLIDEAVELEMQGHPIHTIPYYQHGYTAYSQVYFASESMIRQNPEALRLFLEVSRAGWQAALLDPERTCALIIARYNAKLDPQYQLRSLEKIAQLSTVESGFSGLGAMSRTTWERIVDTFNEFHVLARAVSVAEVTDFNLVNPLPSWGPQTHLRVDFHELGGRYPDMTAPERWTKAIPLTPLEMVASVDPTGHPSTVMMVKAGPNSELDAWWAHQVSTRWQWPAGGWRQFRLEVPVAKASQ